MNLQTREPETISEKPLHTKASKKKIYKVKDMIIKDKVFHGLEIALKPILFHHAFENHEKQYAVYVCYCICQKTFKIKGCQNIVLFFSISCDVDTS